MPQPAAVPGEPPPITVVPFNSQISACPVNWLTQRMSVLPSPLKSPVWEANQATGAEPGEPAPMMVAPLISQITTCPVLLLYQKMSALPSPLTSPVPVICHPVLGGTVPSEPPPMTLVPFISQITACPVVPLRQRMSAKPSPLKSRCPTTAQSELTEPAAPPPMAVVPFMNQITTLNITVGLRQRMSLRASLLKSWVAAKAAVTTPAAMKPVTQDRNVPNNRRIPVLEVGLIRLMASSITGCQALGVSRRRIA